jgi:predicted nucleic acid-binding Zn ribbon protein
MTSCSGEKKGLRLGLYRCPYCGARLQIFSDEDSVTCHSCGGAVVKEKSRCCVEWCGSIRECHVESSPEKGGR